MDSVTKEVHLSLSLYSHSRVGWWLAARLAGVGEPPGELLLQQVTLERRCRSSRHCSPVAFIRLLWLNRLLVKLPFQTITLSITVSAVTGHAGSAA